LQKYFFIALGGSLGSIARFWVGSSVADRMGLKFPYGTFVINMTACLIIGVSLSVLNTRSELSQNWRFFLPIGFVGAYSTFSTFEYETLSTLQSGALSTAVLYVFLSLVLGLAAVWCGSFIGRLIP
jgi:CrcB protein